MRQLSLLILILLFSCEDDGIFQNYGCMNEAAINYEQSANVDDDSCILNITYSYEGDIEQIFSSNCTICHSQSVNSPLPPFLNTYDLIKNCDCTVALDPSASPLYLNIDSGYMPYESSPLSNEDKEKIRIWILEGMPE